MEQTVRIVTDSGSDLSPELSEEYGIEVVPLVVHFGTEVYPDGVLSPEEFWEKATGPQLPRTSQPAVGAFEQVYTRLVAQGNQVLCVTVTGKHSGTFNAARLASERFGEAVHIFDSHSLTLGQALQAVSAARAAREGQSLRQILALVEDLRARMSLLIILDTLEYLRRGGRADAFVAVAERMTRALNIKVIINTVDGQLRLLTAARSSKRALRHILGLVERMGSLEHLAVVHTRNQETAERVAEQLAQLTGFPRERIWLREVGPALASHGGPGAIGVLAVPVSAMP